MNETNTKVLMIKVVLALLQFVHYSHVFVTVSNYHASLTWPNHPGTYHAKGNNIEWNINR